MPVRVVLAGLGHAHLFVLEAAMDGRLPPCDLIVCTGDTRHVYSGMVPGWLGGRYDVNQLSLRVSDLCHRAGATLHNAHVVALDPAARTFTLADGTPVPYDICSVAVGSVPAALDVPGAGDFAVPLKPLANVQRIMDALARMARLGHGHVVVVGGGAAGVEMALGACARLRARGARNTVQVSIVTQDNTLVPERGAAVSRLARNAAARHAVRVITDVRVLAVGVDHVVLDDGRTVRSDLTLWATGAAAAPWLAESGLPCDARGFLRVDDQLRSTGDPHVFAAGDAATLVSAPEIAKAGVYAVRMGPHLVASLAHAAGGAEAQAPAPFTPQKRWLALLNTGDGRAIASWGPFALDARWAMRLKDHIDGAFIRRFAQRLISDG